MRKNQEAVFQKLKSRHWKSIRAPRIHTSQSNCHSETSQDYLLLEDLHDGVFDVVAELGLLDSILEVLLGRLEILTVGVGPRTEDLH